MRAGPNKEMCYRPNVRISLREYGIFSDTWLKRLLCLKRPLFPGENVIWQLNPWKINLSGKTTCIEMPLFLTSRVVFPERLHSNHGRCQKYKYSTNLGTKTRWVKPTPQTKTTFWKPIFILKSHIYLYAKTTSLPGSLPRAWLRVVFAHRFHFTSRVFSKNYCINQ